MIICFGQRKIELNQSVTAIAPLCRSTLELIEQQAQAKEIQINTDIASDLPDMLLDQRRIKQVLINLLSNAVKFTPTGGSISLSTSIEKSEETQDSQPFSSLSISVKAFKVVLSAPCPANNAIKSGALPVYI